MELWTFFLDEQSIFGVFFAGMFFCVLCGVNYLLLESYSLYVSMVTYGEVVVAVATPMSVLNKHTHEFRSEVT